MSDWRGKQAKDRCKPIDDRFLTMEPNDRKGLGVRPGVPGRMYVGLTFALIFMATCGVAIWWAFGWI